MRASTEPRSEDRGEILAGPLPPSTGWLQRSRGPKTAERPIYRRLCFRLAFCFNGAAVRRPRRGANDDTTPSVVTKLQRSRGPKTAERAGRAAGGGILRVASTEPRSEDRGEIRSSGGIRPCGRASTEPRSEDRGEPRTRSSANSSGVASTEPRSEDRGERREATLHRRRWP